MEEAFIERIDEEDEELGCFISEGFTGYGQQNGVKLNYDDFCYAARDGEGRLIGEVTGWAYYNEVHIADLIIAEGHRKSGLGSALVKAVEDAYRGKGYDMITLTTFAFQAPGFYEKLGYRIEFIREDADPKLCKYFFRKDL